jgi:hypothetical protein
MAGFPPLTNQGNLNRVAVHVVVVGNSALNVTAANLGKQLAAVTFEDVFTDQIETATGLVNSPRPYVMAQVVLNLLRSQAIAGLWLAQVEVNSNIGQVTVYSDSSAFPPIELSNASVVNFDPGAFDGVDAITKVTVKGIFYVNNALWAGLTGTLPPAL